MTTRSTRGGRPVGTIRGPAKHVALSNGEGGGPAVDGTAVLRSAAATDGAGRSGPRGVARPATVPPIDARVLLRALMTPPAGVADGSLTDELTGAVPTWRLDEEPIYLDVVRDLGVPALDGSGGGGKVIVGEVVER